MKKICRAVGACLIAASLMLVATGCTTGGSGDDGYVYFLNFKPEIADKYAAITEAYKAETGKDVKVVTAASGTYEQTLTSEIAKSQPPTIFQINGPIGCADWSDYLADLTDTEIYKHLADQSLAVSTADGVWGVPYVVEGYGIIYNDAIMRAYFALPNKAVSITSADQITSWDLLSQVVADMTANKAALGISGVFSATSLKPGDDWRWHTHMAGVPLWYEFSKDNVDLGKGTPATINFTYSNNMKNLFDLYINNSTTASTELGAKTVDEAMSEFAAGQSAMVQNGNWAWSQVSNVKGNTVESEDIKMLPLYMGIPGEESHGIPIGTENYLSINAKVSEASQKASLEFLTWLFSSDAGKKAVANELGFIAPFDWFSANDVPNDPLAREVMGWMTKPGIESVPWSAFMVMPSQDWKNNFGSELLLYAQGRTDWPSVTTTIKADWATQAARSK
ncbi:MAG: ABC transporter substrate-binding protein [Propionibacteriaceae bacterium]|jgi:raffinose/stachyose/melibiose transport system substrate-binding protein|nr:ABC transporter substrate-binding protein [Propionibacteriaceae bacterium]